MTQKAPSPARGRKQTATNSVTHSHSNKLSSENSIWNVECEGAGCGWSAQFSTGREAGEAGWKHHRTVHHYRSECPSTYVFKSARAKSAFPVSFTGQAYPETSGAVGRA